MKHISRRMSFLLVFALLTAMLAFPYVTAGAEDVTEPVGTEETTEPTATEDATEPSATEDATEPVITGYIEILEGEAMEVYVGSNSHTLGVSFGPEDAVEDCVTWLSTADAVVSVDESGKLEFLSVGSATITATGAGGATDSIEVTVQALPENANWVGYGTCGAPGSSLNWTLSKGTLTISGTGKIRDGIVENAPWYDLRWRVAKVKINSGVTAIGDYAFSDCPLMTSITIPFGVTHIGEYAFLSDESLTSVMLPSSVTQIGAYAFFGCEGLTAVNIPVNVTEIQKWTFSNCLALKSFVIPDNVTVIGESAFYDSGLTQIHIPAAVTQIGDTAFAKCAKLADITVAAENPVYAAVDNMLLTKDMTTLLGVGGAAEQVMVPESVTALANGAFEGCTALTAVMLPERLVTIDDYAFSYCTALKSLSIPAGVTAIGSEPFWGSGLEMIYFNGSAPSFGDDVFYELYIQVWYPASDATWTEDIFALGDTVIWVPWSNSVTIAGANMVLGSALDMNFFIDKTTLTGTDYFAVITHYTTDGSKTIAVPYAKWDDRASYMVVTLEDLAARQMADRIEVMICDSEGEIVSQRWVDSVRDYAMRILEKQDDKTKTLLVDMLNYGAAAQTYFDYNTGDLANNQLSPVQQGYATESVTCADQREQGTNYYGSTLVLKNRILLTLYFNQITPDMYAVVTFTDHKGIAHEYRVEGSQFVVYNDSTCGVTIDDLVVADGDQLVTVKIYDTTDSQVAYASDTVNSYAQRMMGSDALFELVAKFTTSAYAYFHS